MLRLHWAGVALLLFLMGTLAFAMFVPRVGTLEDYQSIKTGMDLKQVEDLLGQEIHNIMGLERLLLKGMDKISAWDINEGIVLIGSYEGKVISKCMIPDCDLDTRFNFKRFWRLFLCAKKN